MKKNIIDNNSEQRGAVGILSVILVTTLVLVFMLTISLQVLLGVKNAKLLTDFNKNYYVTEGALRDARMQMKKEETLSKIFLPIVFNDITATRTVAVGLSTTTINVTGSTVSIKRKFQSSCRNFMDGCLIDELTP